MKRPAAVLLFIVFVAIELPAQSDSVVLKAMSDELQRNMTELKYESFESPFYISYSIADVKRLDAGATLGAILRSAEARSRTKNVRVLVGNYEFNDESLDNNNFSPPEMNEIGLPLDDDYFGIRRSLWVTTDYIYKSAARQYKKNLETLKETGKALSETPHRRFAAQPRIEMAEERMSTIVNKAMLEAIVRRMSDVVNRYPSIENSSAFISVVDGYTYFCNSEGTRARVATQQVELHIYAERKTEEGESLYDQISHYASVVEKLPPLDLIQKEVEEMCIRLNAEPVPRFDDAYTGPVLFIGEPVAALFHTALFGMDERLIANDALPDPRGYRQIDQASQFDARVGKLVTSPKLTIRAKALLKEYEGTPLLGSYQIDDEGVIPPAEIAMIENGILREFLNNRSLIRQNEVANGHSEGPSVVEVATAEPKPFASLKEELLNAARRQGLEYALIVDTGLNDEMGGCTIKRISVSDGKEESLRFAMVNVPGLKGLRDLIHASLSMKAHNVQTEGLAMASFIVPEGVIIDDIEVVPGQSMFRKEERYVTRPLDRQ